MEQIVYKGEDGQALTTSMLVAEKFGKEHKYVLEAIRNLIKGCAEKSAFVDNQQITRMFVLIEVEQPMPVGGGMKKIPAYVMNRDGFTLLAMGFTGEKALAFKLEYIKAFNAMEQQIKQSLGVPQTFSQALMLAAKQAEKIEEQQKTIQESAKEIVALSNKVTEMQPKVSYYDKILASKATLTVTQVAQDYGMSAKAFNVMLRNFGIQRKVNGQWVLYRQHLQNGYVHSKSIDIIRHDGQHETKNNTEWTQKGRLFLYEELKRHDVLPLIERG